MRDSWGIRVTFRRVDGSFSPDKQKVNGYEGALCLLSHLTFDLEGLATVTRQVRHLRAQSAEVAHRTPPGKRAPETEINYPQGQPKRY